MPTYEYQCNACHAEFECEQRISAPPHAPCPTCGAEDTRRLISHSSFVLKGSGWYVTDYGRKGANGPSGTKNGKPASTTTVEAAPAATATTEPAKPAASEAAPKAPATPS